MKTGQVVGAYKGGEVMIDPILNKTQDTRFRRDVKPTKREGINLLNKWVTCWGLRGMDVETRRTCFVYLDKPEDAEKYYVEEI